MFNVRKKMCEFVWYILIFGIGYWIGRQDKIFEKLKKQIQNAQRRLKKK